MGGSTGLGSLGYANALYEIMEYEQRTGIRFSRIIHATGSAGTQAGLIDYGRKGRFAPEENVLFIHTGGTAQLFE
jgi:1-aminocyclopropane-1-carboxylate deaminase/D-cysteine desulfhydrase-like pyridoxal-dependent ACC family enzyme